VPPLVGPVRIRRLAAVDESALRAKGHQLRSHPTTPWGHGSKAARRRPTASTPAPSTSDRAAKERGADRGLPIVRASSAKTERDGVRVIDAYQLEAVDASS
jgi:hypothetical protein